MVHRINHHGTFVIDRRYKGIGRIRRASGTKDRKTLKRILGMLTEIQNQGKRSILCEIRDGVVSPMEVYGYWTNDQLKHLPSALTLKRVIPTIPDWIDSSSFDAVATTKRNYKSEISRFCKVVENDITIHDLPNALKRYKTHCIETTHHRTFNGCRKVLLSYINKELGRDHTLYGKVSAIPQLKLKSKRKAPQLSPEEIQSLNKFLPDEHKNIVRAMIYSGMRWTEVSEVGENKWWMENDRVVIKGTKTEYSDRVVPLIREIHKPIRGYLAFRTQLKKFRKGLSPQSFRRSYAHWMDMAKIPESRKNVYMGHSEQSVREGYERHEVDKYLLEDANTLRKWITDQLRQKDDTIQILPVMDADEVQSFLSNPSDTTLP